MSVPLDVLCDTSTRWYLSNVWLRTSTMVLFVVEGGREANSTWYEDVSGRKMERRKYYIERKKDMQNM